MTNDMEDSGNRKEFPGGGMRDTAAGKPRFELLWTEAQPYDDQMLTRAARWMARGAEKYESRNWELFDSPEALEHAKASLLRHTYKLLAGETDEDHAAAVWFNTQAIEYIRWKQLKGLEEVEKEFDDFVEKKGKYAPPRYWKAEAEFGSPKFFYYRLDAEGFTVAYTLDRRRYPAAYRDVDHMRSDRWKSTREIPVDEVPEWAR